MYNIYLELVCPLFWGLKLKSDDLLVSKKIHRSSASFFFHLSHDVTSHAGLLLSYKHELKGHATTKLHPKEHLYNASVYGDIYRYICGGLGVVISQPPPRRVHTYKCEI